MCVPTNVTKRLILPLVLACAVVGEERIDQETNAKIRSEATGRSQLMRTVHVLADRYGPRLTGSPNYADAANWVASQLTRWGLNNAHLEPFDMGYVGWTNERAYGYLTAPVQQNLVFQTLAWTPSTNGTVSGSIVQLVVPEKSPGQGSANGRALGPTREDMTRWLDENAPRVKGKIVMIGRAREIPVDLRPPPAKRLDAARLREQYDPKPSPAPQTVRPIPPQGVAGAERDGLTPSQAADMLDAWLPSSGALLLLRDAARPHGQIGAFGRFAGSSVAIPTVVLRNEDYGRIERLLADGEDVHAEFNIANRTYPEGRTVNNVVAEIPGRDKADEVVMVGAHLDSWHSATGATDNAIGSAIVMEAARIINALGLKPRRTIRVALWAGEEQGLLGSNAYVKRHFGTFEQPAAEFFKLDCYFNVDTGTGRLRGARVFGPRDAADVIRDALAPFDEGGAGIVGAVAGRDRIAGGADTGSFRVAGLPAIGWDADPIEYQSHTWHTNLDTYERILPEDAVKTVTVIAAAIWHMSNRDQMLPRFSKEQMPQPPGVPARATPTGTGKD
jgi:carboxypeptidase Q